jgi:hypothetical protein
MSLLKKPYEISLWRDTQNEENDESSYSFSESRIAILGGDTMEY